MVKHRPDVFERVEPILAERPNDDGWITKQGREDRTLRVVRSISCSESTSNNQRHYSGLERHCKTWPKRRDRSASGRRYAGNDRRQKIATAIRVMAASWI